jgi:HrpA-like RNA helicase
MSATLNISDFTTFFPNATSIEVPGRTFPVSILYTDEPVDDYMDACLDSIMMLHNTYREDDNWGDILVFLPGQDEIEDMQQLLRSALKSKEAERKEEGDQKGSKIFDQIVTDRMQSLKGMGKNVLDASAAHDEAQVVTLYAALPPEQQMIAFAPNVPGAARKIVLSTNLAETSVTLADVAFVVDSGRHKTRRFNAGTGMESLEVESIAKAQGTQRAGRSGRTRPGVCLRLYTEETWEELEENAVPEILRVNLAQVVLQLKSMGIKDPRAFDYVTPPDTQSLMKAFSQLFALGALDKAMELTEHGKKMALLPLAPTFAHMLLKSREFGCVSEILSVVSMLSADNIFFRPTGEGAQRAAAAHKRFVSHEGDLSTLLFVYKTWKAEAAYIAAGDKHRAKKLKQQVGKMKVSHGEWCSRNYINGRALVRANDVRAQLEELCGRSTVKGGLGMDVGSSCGTDMLVFLKCICAGLFLQSASRDGVVNNSELRKQHAKGGGGGASLQGRYKTTFGGFTCNVHPTSTMFQRNPAPKTIVYTELVVTKKNYIRGVTQIKREWLAEVAPLFKSEFDGIGGGA